MKFKFFLFIAIVSVAGMLAMSGCNRDDDEESWGESVRISRATGELAGHEYVDLGLPSGILWATCNVGANSPQEYGDYYAWGETTTKVNYDEGHYTYSGPLDNPTILSASNDAATANWGNGWRMPNIEEFEELLRYCTYRPATYRRINGFHFIGPNGNSIFLPAAGYCDHNALEYCTSEGYYWSRTYYNREMVLHFEIYGCNISDYSYYGRFAGRSVRPVCNR